MRTFYAFVTAFWWVYGVAAALGSLWIARMWWECRRFGQSWAIAGLAVACAGLSVAAFVRAML